MDVLLLHTSKEHAAYVSLGHSLPLGKLLLTLFWFVNALLLIMRTPRSVGRCTHMNIWLFTQQPLTFHNILPPIRWPYHAWGDTGSHIYSPIQEDSWTGQSDDLAPRYHPMLLQSFEAGFLARSMSEAVVVVIFKPDKNPFLCSSYKSIPSNIPNAYIPENGWRVGECCSDHTMELHKAKGSNALLNDHITLKDSVILLPRRTSSLGMCHMLKMLTKVLSNCLNKVITSFVHADQSKFMPGRGTKMNICWLFFHMAKAPADSLGVAVSLDATKSFYSVVWDYLWDILCKFVFRPLFISCLRMLYSSLVAKVHSNNSLSAPYPLNRGTKQGCPLSLGSLALFHWLPKSMLLTQWRVSRSGLLKEKLSLYI